MSLWVQPLKKFADFSGRATRTEYWGFMLFNILVMFGALIVATVVMAAMGGFAAGSPPPAASMTGGFIVIALCLYYLYIIIPSFAVAFRRLHDINKSAVWLLIAFVPFVGAVVLLVFTLMDGTAGPNIYGPDPKGREGLPGAGGMVIKEVHHHHYGAPPAEGGTQTVS